MYLTQIIIKRKIPVLLGLIVLLSVPIQAQYTSVDPFERHLSIVSMEDGNAPVFFPLSDEILFTFKPGFSGRPRHVAIAFEHENFSVLHSLERNNQGVFFSYIPLEESVQDSLEEIRYRYVVDGVWLTDPNNLKETRSPGGFPLSIVDLPKENEGIMTSPIIIDEESSSKLMRFYIYSEAEQEIYLSGSFSNWDPYMYRMNEHSIMQGYYFIDIRLRPGEYHYYFLKNGVRVLDPQNTMIGFDQHGYQYSRVIVES